MKDKDILNELVWNCKDGDINLRSLRTFLQTCKSDKIEDIIKEINNTKFDHSEFTSPKK